MSLDRGAWWLVAAGLILAVVCAAVRSAEPVLVRDWKQDGNKRATSWGTAFAVDAGVLTALHTLKGGTLELKVGGEWVPAEVVARDEGLDLALLKTSAKLTPFKLATTATAEEAYSIDGFPRGERKTISARVSGVSGSRVSLRTAGFDHGFSGAPVLNKSGCVVGVAVSGDKGPDGDIDPSAANAVALLEIQAFLRRVAPVIVPPEYTHLYPPPTKAEPVPVAREPPARGAKLLATFAAGSDWRAVRTPAGVVFERAEADALGDRAWRRAAPQYEDPEWSRAAIAALVKE